MLAIQSLGHRMSLLSRKKISNSTLSIGQLTLLTDCANKVTLHQGEDGEETVVERSGAGLPHQCKEDA